MQLDEPRVVTAGHGVELDGIAGGVGEDADYGAGSAEVVGV